MPQFVDVEWSVTETNYYKTRIEVPEGEDPEQFVQDLRDEDRHEWLPMYEEPSAGNGFDFERGGILATVVTAAAQVS